MYTEIKFILPPCNEIDGIVCMKETVEGLKALFSSTELTVTFDVGAIKSGLSVHSKGCLERHPLASKPFEERMQGSGRLTNLFGKE
jgi:hypothetical protein